MALGGPIQAIPHDARPAIKPVHASTPHTTHAAATKPAPKTPSWLTTAGIEATKQANDSIAPEVQGLQGQQQTYDAQQKAYEAAMTGFYSALAPYMAGIQSHVSDAYNSAAQTMGDIGHGYAGTLGASSDANTAETNAALARAGQAPTTAPGAALTDSFAAQHGGSQGTSFAAEGAAKASDAANQPAVWAAQGRDSMTEAIQKAVAGDADFQKQIATVYAKVPALRQQILSTMQDLKIKQDTLDFNEKAKIESLKQGQTRLEQSGARLNLTAQMDAFDQKYKVAGLKLRGQALQLQANKFAVQQMQSNRNYKLAFDRLGISQAKDQRSALAAQYKFDHGGFDQKTIIKWNGQLQNRLNEIQTVNNPDGTTTYLITDTNTKINHSSDWKKVGSGANTVWQKPITYVDFLRGAVAMGVPPSIAIDRADKFFPPAARPQGPGALDFALGTGSTNQTSSTWSTAKQGKVGVAPNANRPGVPINPVVTSFVGALAGLVGQPLTIGTGSNHNKMTTDGNVSDHWDGNAADIPSSGASLTRLGQNALILAGADPAWARKQTGGLFNMKTAEGRVQIIFNTKQGGNHFNHLHVGISPG